MTVDEMARHAITKLSSLHFSATNNSAARIRKMGEEEWRIHVVGAPALDTILHERLPSRQELFKKLELDPAKPFILVIQHPLTESYQSAGREMNETIAAVKTFNMPIVIVYPHADLGGKLIIEAIEREWHNPLFHIFPSVPFKEFLALEREAAVWVGNSSGAMIESSSFCVPVINIGQRQDGREHGDNVTNVDHSREAIQKAIDRALHDEVYRAKLKSVTNPWGDGKTGPRVAKILEDLNLADPKLLLKQITY